MSCGYIRNCFVLFIPTWLHTMSTWYVTCLINEHLCLFTVQCLIVQGVLRVSLFEQVSFVPAMVRYLETAHPAMFVLLGLQFRIPPRDFWHFSGWLRIGCLATIPAFWLQWLPSSWTMGLALPHPWPVLILPVLGGMYHSPAGTHLSVIKIRYADIGSFYRFNFLLIFVCRSVCALSAITVVRRVAPLRYRCPSYCQCLALMEHICPLKGPVYQVSVYNVHPVSIHTNWNISHVFHTVMLCRVRWWLI